MDIMQKFPNIAWCKPDWSLPSMSNETKELLQQCINLPTVDLTVDVDEIIQKSKAFPIPFPIETVRLTKLKERRPVEKLKENIISTYPLVHERVLVLMANFLNYKRTFGTSIEKELYKEMTVPQFIERLLKKRALVFVGAADSYRLLSGEEGLGDWESVGTLNQNPPLVLENCLSYDEMKLSAFLYVSGPTECINNGTRRNQGAVKEDGTQPDAVIIGVIGPRFTRRYRNDCEDILIIQKQNRVENGYGEETTLTSCLKMLKISGQSNQSSRRVWRQMWSEFYQVPSHTYGELSSQATMKEKPAEAQYIDRYAVSHSIMFDNEVYYKRLCVLAETVLLETEERARAAGKNAFLNIIGAGLGVWRISQHQPDVYILSFLERIRAYLEKGLINHITDINFAYIPPSDGVLALFTNSTSPVGKTSTSEKRIFCKCEGHPKGGINVQLENREPSARLTGEHEGKLLVMIYPWDSNAHPGNEFWYGQLSSSGDPAAACSTQVAELHNAHINPVVSGDNTRVAGRNGVKTLPEYCSLLTA